MSPLWLAPLMKVMQAGGETSSGSSAASAGPSVGTRREAGSRKPTTGGTSE